MSRASAISALSSNAAPAAIGRSTSGAWPSFAPSKVHGTKQQLAIGARSGGRHRSVVVAEELAARLLAAGIGVETEHRHVDRPILT
ncbi:hypothetical protein ACFYM7_34830 [Streptomyces cyaneofuscatus]|uniref:RapZ C-terminal domain-containing protein n=1 Tax=Streptomyces cyaneofuscatus TaxID=66883 RepID=UPI00367E3B4D